MKWMVEYHIALMIPAIAQVSLSQHICLPKQGKRKQRKVLAQPKGEGHQAFTLSC